MKLLAELTLQNFAPHMHTCFNVPLPVPAADGATHVPLELIEVMPLSAAPLLPSDQCGFSLVFVGPESRYYLNQRTHTVQHSVLGELGIFMTPQGPSADPAHGRNRMLYQAIFN